jgi:formylmethanofuran dehydrogenase subunit E
VIGYRMGKLAIGELGSDGHFGVSAEVHSPLKTPRSCLIDGVQLGSGCTLGKGNISVEEAPEPAWAVFRSDRGQAVTLRLRLEIPALVADLVNRDGVEAAGRAFLEMPLDSLFVTENGVR